MKILIFSGRPPKKRTNVTKASGLFHVFPAKKERLFIKVLRLSGLYQFGQQIGQHLKFSVTDVFKHVVKIRAPDFLQLTI